MRIVQKFWWVVALQGLILIATGALAVINSNITIHDLVEYLALTFLIFGAVLLASGSFLRKRSKHWWVLFSTGLLETALGLTVLFSPAHSTEYFTKAMAIFAALIGLLELGYAIFRSTNRIFNGINAFLSLAFGALIYFNPFDSFRALTYLVAFYAVVLGILVIIYSVKLRLWSAKKLKPKPSSESHPTEKSADQASSSPPQSSP